MRVFYGYARVSKLAQVKEDGSDSIAAQEQMIRAEFERLKASGLYEDLVWGGFFTDAGKSASKYKLFQREQGAALLVRLQPGDIICSRAFDRIFRNASDALSTKEKIDSKGVKLILLDFFGMDMRSDMGMLMFDIYAAIKAFEGRENRRRTMDVIRLRKEQGKVHTGTAAVGYVTLRQLKGGIIRKRLVPDIAIQWTLRIAYRLYVYEMWSYNMVARFLNYLGHRTRHGKLWATRSVADALIAAQSGFPPRLVANHNQPVGSRDAGGRVVQRPLQPVFLLFDEEYDGTKRQCLSYLGTAFLRDLGLYDGLSGAGLLGGWTQKMRDASASQRLPGRSREHSPP